MSFCRFPRLRASFRFMFHLRQDALNHPWMSKWFHYRLAARLQIHLSYVCVCDMFDNVRCCWMIYLPTFGSFVRKKNRLSTYYIFHTLPYIFGRFCLCSKFQSIIPGAQVLVCPLHEDVFRLRPKASATEPAWRPEGFVENHGGGIFGCHDASAMCFLSLGSKLPSAKFMKILDELDNYMLFLFF